MVPPSSTASESQSSEPSHQLESSPKHTAQTHQTQQSESPSQPTHQQFQEMQQGYEAMLQTMRTDMAAAAKAHAASLATMQHQIDQLVAASNASAASLAASRPLASETESIAKALQELKQEVTALQEHRGSSAQNKPPPYETPRANRSLFDTFRKDPAYTAFGPKSSNTQVQPSSSSLSTNDLSNQTRVFSSSLSVSTSPFVQAVNNPTLHRIEYRPMSKFISAIRSYYGKGGHLHIHRMLTDTVQEQLKDLWNSLKQSYPDMLISYSEWLDNTPTVVLQQEQMLTQFIKFFTTYFAVDCSLETSAKPAPSITSFNGLNRAIHEFYKIKTALHLVEQTDSIINDHLLRYLSTNNKEWMGTFYIHLQRSHGIAKHEVRNMQFSVLLELIKSFYSSYINTLPSGYSNPTSREYRKDRQPSSRDNDNRYPHSSRHSNSKRYRRDRSNSQSRHGRTDHHYRGNHHSHSSNYKPRRHDDNQGHNKSVSFPRYSSGPSQHFGYRDSSMSDDGSVRSGGSQYTSRSGYSSHSSASRNSHQSQKNSQSASAPANNSAPPPKPSSSSPRPNSSGSHQKKKP
jgi:hypothetical protein